jgi:hypothetical protein
MDRQKGRPAGSTAACRQEAQDSHNFKNIHSIELESSETNRLIVLTTQLTAMGIIRYKIFVIY